MNNITYHHQPVFLDFFKDQVLRESDTNIFDATLGEGGHTEAFLKRGLHVSAIERDNVIKKKAEARLSDWCITGKLTVHSGNFGEPLLPVFSDEQPPFDFALFDLGISKFHYFESGRGFSFSGDERLDMRLDDGARHDAYEIINFFDEKKIADIFYYHGGMTNARVMASYLCKYRRKKKITTALELAETVKAGPHFVKPGGNHPATMVFQALRIFINDELGCIAPGILNCIKKMKPGGRIAVISYHSLEDKIVKKTFNEMLIKRENINKYRALKSEDVKTTDLEASLKNIQRKCTLWQKKVITPSREEVLANRAARSAKLRILIIA